MSQRHISASSPSGKRLLYYKEGLNALLEIPQAEQAYCFVPNRQVRLFYQCGIANASSGYLFPYRLDPDFLRDGIKQS
jgi:hypothetical protein